AVCKGQPAALFENVYGCLDPVTNLCRPREIQCHAGRNEARRRRRGERHRIAKRDVGEGCENASVYGSSGIAVSRLDPKREHEILSLTTAVQRADQLENWTRAE